MLNVGWWDTEDSTASLATNSQYSSHGRQCCQPCNQSAGQQLRKAVLPSLQPIRRTAATEGSAAILATNPHDSSYGRQCCQPCSHSAGQLRHQATVQHKQTHCCNVRLCVNPSRIFVLRVGSSATSNLMKVCRPLPSDALLDRILL